MPFAPSSVRLRFGIWWDPWNIDAYLVHERAHVYSMELRDPQARAVADGNGHFARERRIGPVGGSSSFWSNY